VTDSFNFTFGSNNQNHTLSVPTPKLFLDAKTSTKQKVCLLGILGHRSIPNYVFGGVFLRQILVHLDFEKQQLGLSPKFNREQKEREQRFAIGIGIFIGIVGVALIVIIVWIKLNKRKKKELKEELVEEENTRIKSGLL
jgi:uncharacterized membrane protein